MTYTELLDFLDQHLNYPFLEGHNSATILAAAQSGQVEDPLTREVVLELFRANACTSVSDPVERATSFNGLASLRLRSQADDSDPHLFRKVLKLSQELDNAFDQELIRQRG
ncbi:hypothetical protein [Acidithiobacillus sulfuriphilus]|uniref:hypothetical protein n=1 Tax=Acidithiobacillus sulfuriphilus TaxID=1867749 RepID=UPI003F628033